MKITGRYFFLIGVAFVVSFQLLPSVYGQTPAPKKTQVYLIHADESYYEKGDSTTIDRLVGNVNVRYDSIFLFCDTANIHADVFVAVGHASLVQGDSLKIFADTLTYNSRTGISHLLGHVLMINGNQRLRTDSLQYDTRTKIATYHTGAFLENLKTRMYSQRGYYHVNEETIYFKDSVRIQDPQFRLKTDSLYYRVRENKAFFTGPTLIRQQKANLYCERGYYDLNAQEGLFTQNAQFVDTSRQATADKIFYKANPEQFILYGDANYRDGTRLATGDTLDYQSAKGDFKVRGNAFIQDGGQTIRSAGIDYNTRTEKFRTIGRANVQDGGQSLQADDIRNTDTSDVATVVGHVIWRDTVAKVTLTCDSALYQRSTGYFLAMGDPPVLIQELDGDTLYLVADRIQAIRREGPDSTREIHAFPNVLIYKSDLQASCDSLVYSERDSAFFFYQDPVIWSDTSQFTADTVSIRMANDAIDSIYLWRKALIINAPDEPYYNQIKGRTIIASFVDGELSRMDVNGNAESVYYARDEKNEYLGVNTSACSEMVLFFKDNQVQDIYYLREPKSVMYPMDQVDHGSLKLEAFKWRVAEKPMNYADLLDKWRAKQTSRIDE
ncbi:MAG: hypothetical protein K9I85_01295 [Saprospiraceae bacterium]|nr:hypothetical protein [Saprospiraceae bacterium]